MTPQRAFPVLLETALLLWLLLPLRAVSARHWIARPGGSVIQDPGSKHPALYILPTHFVNGGVLEDDVERDSTVMIPTLVESPKPVAWAPVVDHDRPGSVTGSVTGSVRPVMIKRQVRYHQCYFNPISCFG